MSSNGACGAGTATRSYRRGGSAQTCDPASRSIPVAAPSPHRAARASAEDRDARRRRRADNARRRRRPHRDGRLPRVARHRAERSCAGDRADAHAQGPDAHPTRDRAQRDDQLRHRLRPRPRAPAPPLGSSPATIGRPLSAWLRRGSTSVVGSTSTIDPVRGRSVWTVGPNQPTATMIAGVDPPFSDASILDISSDGSEFPGQRRDPIQ